MVIGQITFFEDRSQLELVWSHFVVTGFYRDTQFESLNFEVFHKGSYAGRDSTEIVIFQLLVLGTVMSHQRTSCHEQVRACGIQTFVYQEIFLFPAQVGNYFLHFRIEVVTYVYGSFIYGTQCFQ